MKKLILLSILFLLTGCYNYVELEDLAIVSAIFIEYDEEYKVTYEIYDTKEESRKAYFIKSSGSTIEEALTNINTLTDKTIYLSHLHILVLDNYVTQNNLKNIYEIYTRDVDVRKDFYVLYSDQIKNIDTLELDENIGQTVYDLIKTNKKTNGYFFTLEFRDLLKSYLNNSTSYVGEIVFDKDIKLNSVYKIDINFTKMNDNEVLLYNIVNKNVESFTYISNNTYEIYEYSVNKSDIKFNVRLKTVYDSSAFTISDITNLESKLEEELSKYFNKEELNIIVNINEKGLVLRSVT